MRPGGTKSKIVTWLDDNSRYCCHLEAFADERFPVIETTLKRTILKHGLPKRVLVDNGSVYCCKNFCLACSQLGILVCHSAPYHPESKGKVEKWHQYLRRWLLNEIENIDPLSLEKMNRLLVALAERYNNRQHKATGMTPLQRFQPLEHRSVSLQTLEESFWQWDSRSVSPQGRIEFNGNLYHVDLSLANHKVVIRYDPFDLRRIIVWRDGRKLAEATSTELRYASRPTKKKPDAKQKAKSDISKQYLETLEKTKLVRLNQELNQIHLPEAEEVDEDE